MRLAAKTVGIAVVLGIGTAAAGDVILYDLEQGWDEFNAAIDDCGYLYKGETWWEQYPDWGLFGLDGPVHGPDDYIYEPGDVPWNMAFDSNLNPWGICGPNGRGVGGNGLVAVGPGAGFGNPSNALLANYFVDSFDIMFYNDEPECIKAVALWTLTLLGSNTVDISVYGPADPHNPVAQFFGLPAPAAGHWYGIYVTCDQPCINRINIYDPGGGAEGVMKVIKWEIPAPGCLALLGLAGLARRRRR